MRIKLLKYSLLFLVIFISAAIFFNHNSSSQTVSRSNQILLQFICYNSYGNNLFIDNIFVSNKKEVDAGITSISGIGRDTFYILPRTNNIVYPKALLSNLGKHNIDSAFYTICEIQSFSYLCSLKITSLSIGTTAILEFDSLEISTDIPFEVKVFTTLADSNKNNDTLAQSAIYFDGYKRNTLLEEWTSSTSISCGINNSYLNTFVDSNRQNICAIKYHTGFPPPGNDSMYLYNPTTVDNRVNYYSIGSVPSALIDGRNFVQPPFYSDSALIKSFSKSQSKASPLSLIVSDTLTGTDSLEAVVSLSLKNNLTTGIYKLRVYAIQSEVVYEFPIGVSGENIFYDVFRKSFTDSNGFTINPSQGNYEYKFTIPLDSVLSGTNISTVAYIQNDVTKEILNCGKSLINVVRKGKNKNAKFQNYSLGKNLSDLKKNAFYNSAYFSSRRISKNTFNNYELFEWNFPPDGWTLYNYDNLYTFEECDNVNGISFSGNKCIKFPFYFYSNFGQRDTLISISFQDVKNTDTLSFDYAYAPYLSTFADSLIVNISIDGGNTYTNIFRKGGYSLATAPTTSYPFTPISANEWKTFKYGFDQILPPDFGTINYSTYKLFQNYPNPFNPATKISFYVSKKSFVSLGIFDIAGRLIKTLVNEEKDKGFFEYQFDASGLSSGVYFYKFVVSGANSSADSFSESKKMLLIK